MNLNITQKNMVEAIPNGQTLIKGVAGSGKTTVGVYRLHHLENYFCEKNDTILFLTYNKIHSKYLEYIASLAENENYLFKLFNKNKNKSYQIKTIDSVIYQLYNKLISPNKVKIFTNTRGLYLQAMHQAQKKFPEENIINNKNIDFIMSEIAWIKACAYTDEEVYLSVTRTGRVSKESNTILRKNSEKRRAIIYVMNYYDKLLKQKSATDYPTMALAVREAIHNKKIEVPKFKHIIVDEAQDLSRAKLDIIRSMYDENKEKSSIMFLTDIAQSIYPESWLAYNTFKSIGFDMSGKTKTLQKNYRTTYEVARAANSLINNDINITTNENYVKAEVLERHDDKPILNYFKNETEEYKYIANKINELIHSGDYKADDICLMTKNKTQFDSLKQYIEKKNISVQIIKKASNQNSFQDNSVKMLTMHSAKGLEFPIVFIYGLYDGIIPYVNNNIDNQDIQISTERKLLYVGMTRAKNKLFMSSLKNKPSSLLAEIDPNTLQIFNGDKQPKQNKRNNVANNKFVKPYKINVDKYLFSEKLANKYSKEEIIRQWLLDVLITKYNFPLEMLDIEFKVQKFSVPGFVDIVAFVKQNNNKIPILFCEVKTTESLNERSFIQLEQYVKTTGSIKYALLTNGFQTYQYTVENGELKEGKLPLYQDLIPKQTNYINLLKKEQYHISKDSKENDLFVITLLKHNQKYHSQQTVKIPLVGTVSAGTLKTIYSELTKIVPLPQELLTDKQADYFILQVDGYSMIEACIEPNDYVLVKKTNVARNQDIVIAVVDDQATIKTISKIKDKIILTPQNRNMEAIIIENENFYINGVVEGLIKK